MAIRTDLEKPVLYVGEVKVYPDRGGHTDASELASARAQAGIYLHGLDLVVEALGVDKKVDVCREGFLVLTRPGSNFPSVRAGEDLRYQAERAKRGFELLESAAESLDKELWAKETEEVPDELIAAVLEGRQAIANLACHFATWPRDVFCTPNKMEIQSFSGMKSAGLLATSHCRVRWNYLKARSQKMMPKLTWFDGFKKAKE